VVGGTNPIISFSTVLNISRLLSYKCLINSNSFNASSGSCIGYTYFVLIYVGSCLLP